MRRIGAVLLALSGCSQLNPDYHGDARAPETTLPVTAPALVQDLVWGGTNYDVRHVDKEKFLQVLRLCWDSASRASPGSAGITRVDLKISPEGYVIEESVSVALFHDLFVGAQDVEGETAYLQCAERGFHHLVVMPAETGNGTLFFDARLLPARSGR